MLVVYINKMYFIVDYEMVDKVEISRFVLVYIGFCWMFNLILFYGIIIFIKFYGKCWNLIDEIKLIYCKFERDWYMILLDVFYCVSSRKMFIIYYVLYIIIDVLVVI